MDDLKCRGYAGNVPVYCAHDKIVPIGEIKPNPKNPNQHPEEQIELLAKIIKTQGWRAPVTVSTLTGLVVRGHGRLMAAQHLGLDSVPVDFQHYTCYDAELADLLADNKIAELAEIDNEMLAEVFKDIDPDAIDIDITGYNEEEYKSITAALTEAVKEPELKDLDENVTPPKVSTTKLGDIWQIGRHRLMCGDSTNRNEIDKLLSGDMVNMIYTDPPYGMNLDTDYSSMQTRLGFAKEKGLTGGKKYDSGEVDSFNPKMISTILDLDVKETFLWGADYFAELLPCKNDGSWIVWDKRANGNDDIEEDYSSDKMYGSCFELCWSKNRHKREIARVKWAGVFGMEQEVDRRRHHPTQKPVKLSSWFINKYSKADETILDLFGGSGSTLLSCEQLGRICRIMEIDTKYCDVIVRRYMAVTGKQDVVLVRNGKEIPVEKTGILD